MDPPAPAPSIRELREDARRGRLAPASVLSGVAAAQRAADEGPLPVRAFLSLELEHAAAEAERQRARAGWAELPLAAVPIAVKDNLATLHLPTTCASRLLEGYRSPYEATVVRRLRAAGALVVGKTNLDEFAMGASTEHSAFGATRNPHDRARVPGGSSGGSAAAVAAGIVPAALGSDTGGSVRQPAAFCGVVGVKPTYGRVSRYGLVSFASSLDQVGVLGARVDDAARLLAAVSGHDPLDSTSAELPPVEMPGRPPADLRGVVIGVAEEYFPHTLHRGVAAACRAALRQLDALGAEIREVSLPHTEYALPAYHVLAAAEAASNLARYDGARFGRRAPGAETADEMVERTRAWFGAEARRRVLLGTHVLSAGYREQYYLRAQRVRARVAEDFRHVFASGVDALLTPTTPGPAFPLGAHLDDPYGMYLSDAFTVGANLAGLPALSLPVGTADGLPVGAQLIGRPWEEAWLLRLAAALEQAMGAPAAPARG